MSTRTMRLHARPFELIAKGNKTIEARLYDDKRKDITVGDTIRFVNREDGATLTATVVRLLRSDSFLHLFTDHDVRKFGGTDPQESAASIREFYSQEEERRNGVLGIEFEIVPV